MPGAPRPGGWPGGPGSLPAQDVPPVPSVPQGAAKPPLVFLVLAAVLAVAGAVVTGLTWGSALSLLGWALVGPLAIGAMTLFSVVDTGRRAAPLYDGPPWLRPAQVLVTVIVVAGIVASSVSIAMWVGRW